MVRFYKYYKTPFPENLSLLSRSVDSKLYYLGGKTVDSINCFTLFGLAVGQEITRRGFYTMSTINLSSRLLLLRLKRRKL